MHIFLQSIYVPMLAIQLIYQSSQHLSNYIQLLKIGTRSLKSNYRPAGIFPLSQKYLRRSSVSNCLTILKIYFYVFSAASERLNMV